MLRVNQISKRFGSIEAVKNVSFHVKEGSTFAFLGTNGAGKTTVIQMMIELLKPDHGEIIFSDGNLQEVTGVVFQNHRLDEELTIEENLIVRALLHGMGKKAAKERVAELLNLTNLTDKRQRLYGKCSGGEKRKTDILRALLHHPRFLILDEPTTGLDAESREEIWSLLRQLQKEQGITIFLTTHYIDEAEYVDYVLIMHEGSIEVEGTPDELRREYSKTVLTLYPLQKDNLIACLHDLEHSFVDDEDVLHVTLDSTIDAIPILHDGEPYLADFSINKASLENVFLQVTEQIKRKVSV
ncbi:MAG TPA: ABC transporter ATP-binding protein [Bacillota bacterium]|nr:ABC transporter ATP-binding protein [Bacillota bacterium]